MTQMLLRGSNGVGYTNYSDNVVQAFVTQAAKSGVDVFRVFDSLNWVENMRVAMDAVIEANKICEAAICYTGDLLDPARAKYDLKYYVGLAKELERAGAHVLGLKDMAGLLKVPAAKILFKALKEEVGLPIHFHTHDTSGASAATVLAAAEAGVDAVDAAMDAFAGGTSQPALGSIVEALRFTERDTGLEWRPSASCPSTGSMCARNMQRLKVAFRPQRPRSTCTRCPVGSSPTSRRRPALLGWRSGGMRWPGLCRCEPDLR